MKPRANFDAAEDGRRVIFDSSEARAAGMQYGLSDSFLDFRGLNESVTHQVPVRAHERTVAGPDTPSGEQRKAAALMALEGKQGTKAALVYVRAKLVELYESRVRALPNNPHMHGVTSDDADRILREWPQCPDEAKEEHAQQNWRGSIWRRGWKQTGVSKPSIRKRMHQTLLPLWRPL